ncbi:MAG: S8 family serine peptidase, partial [Thermoflexales bacterium]
ALETLLALVAGGLVALLASVWIDRTLYAPAAARLPVSGRSLIFEGAVIGVALMAVGSGAGFDGGQILLMLPLWAIGVTAAGLYRLGGVRAMAAFVWPVIALPLALVDPDELTLLLGGHDVLSFMPAAIVAASLSALALSTFVLIARRRLTPPTLPIAIALAALVALGMFSIYALAGKPGLYGERLFVILKDQADLRPTTAIVDRDTRMKAVYDTLTVHAERTQAPLRRTLTQLGIAHTPYYLVNAIEVDGGLPLKVFLLAQPEVARVLDSPHLRPLPASAPAEVGDEPAPLIPQWNLTSIGAERAWNELRITGSGIVVGQSDSGVDVAHPALRDGYRGRGGSDDYNWLDPWNHSPSPVDVGGHGTHTLGSIVGRAAGRNAPTGVAPDAEWFGCVNLARNLANPALYLDCLQFMLAPWPRAGDPLKDGNPRLGAHVINNSWGCPPLEGCDAQALEPAVNALRAAGVFVVASAGNAGPGCETIKDPIALYDASFSVAAVNSRGEIADFSSRGPVRVDGSGRIKPDIAAPGVGVLSTLPGGTYGSESGTSMAGPHIAGVVVLMWSAQPKLIGNIDATERILRETARPAGATAPTCGGTTANVLGAGIVDAYAAVKAAQAFK